MIDALITGADGFIGRALVQRLRADGSMQVLPVTRRDGDVAGNEMWDQLPVARTVVHLAGRSYVPDSWIKGPDFIRTNVLGTEQALSYCRRHQANLVLASAYVYGVPDSLPISEDALARPNNPYALSKWMAEELCEFASRCQGVSATILRLFNVYGSGQRSEFLIPQIIRNVRERRDVSVLSLTPRRDYVFLDDVVEAFVQALKSVSGFKRFNIASGISYSVKEVIDVAQSVTGTSLAVVSRAIDRPQEIPDTRADITRARDELRWAPRWSFEEGIRRLFQESVL